MLFVKEGVNLSDEVRNKFAEWSTNTGRPLRVLFGGYTQFTPGPWSEDEADSCGVSLEQATSEGVTAVVWGSATEFFTREQNELPAGFFTDSQARSLDIKEVMAYQDGAMIQGIPLENDGFEFGEFSERVVWYFLFLNHLPQNIDYDKLITNPLTRSIDPTEVADFKALADERAAKAFARIMQGDPEARLQDVRQRIDVEENNVTQWQTSIMETRRRLDMMRREYDSIFNSMSQPEEFWLKEWGVLKSHPMIAPDSLRVQEGAVNYETKMLNIDDNGNSLPIGRFRIKINLRDCRINITNINNRRNGRDHPHVNGENPCWGGYEAEVLRYLQNSQVSELVEFIFGYLQSYNSDDDWGRYIRLWREQPEVIAA